MRIRFPTTMKLAFVLSGKQGLDAMAIQFGGQNPERTNVGDLFAPAWLKLYRFAHGPDIAEKLKQYAAQRLAQQQTY